MEYSRKSISQRVGATCLAVLLATPLFAQSYETTPPNLDVSDYYITEVCSNPQNDNQIITETVFDCPSGSTRPMRVGEFVQLKNRNISRIDDSLSQLLPYSALAIPRETSNPNVVNSFVIFDGGDGSDSRGVGDYDDPHCNAHSSNAGCFRGYRAESDIYDIGEVKWSSPSSPELTIAGTGHLGTGGWLPWLTPTAAINDIGGWPLAAKNNNGRPTTDILINFYTDSNGSVDSYTLSNNIFNIDRTICTDWIDPAAQPIVHYADYQSVPNCNGTGQNQFMVVEKIYVGKNSAGQDIVLEDALVSIHAGSISHTCAASSHLELFVHSKKYGFVSHQTYRVHDCGVNTTPVDYREGCPVNSGVAGLWAFKSSTIGAFVTAEQHACDMFLNEGYDYTYDSDVLPMIARSQESYPSATGVAGTGFGNLVLNGQFNFVQPTSNWVVGGAAIAERVTQSFSDPAPQNEAIKISCLNGNCSGNTYMYQDVWLTRVPSSESFTHARFGARVSPIQQPGQSTKENLSGVISIFQYNAIGQTLDNHTPEQVSFETNSAGEWPSSDPRVFFEATISVDPNAVRVRYQINFYSTTDKSAYVIDDTFFTPTNFSVAP